jgi:hypothetical protein
MKIFLAGENGKERLIRKLADVNIFSGGGRPVTGFMTLF